MGLSIHFKGRIKDPQKLPELIEEITDIAKSQEWEYVILDDVFTSENAEKEQFKKNLFGMCFTPPGCETVFICFLADGRMSTPIELQYFEIKKDDGTDECLSYVSVKTQYAGIEVHKTIINLFRHLNEKYFTSFSMYDESGYWETGDENVMKKQFDIYNRIMDRFETELRNNDMKADETYDDYITRIAQSVKDMEKE